MLRRVIREPLLHFLIAGALIFAAYNALDEDAAPSSPNAIVIGDAEMQFLRAQFEKLWGRPPTDQDLGPLVREFIREEVLYREGVAMGLDRDDVIVRRRIGQKMEFLIGDLAVPAEPDDETLAKYLDANRDKYLEPPRLTFTHVYFNVDRRGAQARADAEAVLPELRDRERAPELGDRFALSVDYAGKTVREVDQTFGPAFGEQLLAAPVGEWFGPVESAYGLHLVRVLGRTQPRFPDFEELRDRLSADYSFKHARPRTRKRSNASPNATGSCTPAARTRARSRRDRTTGSYHREATANDIQIDAIQRFDPRRAPPARGASATLSAPSEPMSISEAPWRFGFAACGWLPSAPATIKIAGHQVAKIPEKYQNKWNSTRPVDGISGRNPILGR